MSDPPREIRHLSHSSRDTFERCAKSWFLKYIARAPQQPAVWSVGGSAVHRATELYDLRSMLTSPAGHWDIADIWERSFEVELTKAREKDPNENAWRRAGGDDIDAWRRMGLGFVQWYIDWRERSPWEIWTTPDGEPAIELDISGRLPGCDVEIKAYLDRVFWDPTFKRYWIVDLKTSKRPPRDAAQFGVYRALLKVKYDVDIADGVAFMNRLGTLARPFDLTEYTPEAVGQVFAKTWAEIQRGEFPATGIENRGCFICDVSAACAAVNGPLARLYDPASPGYTPF